jgi:hypothetical protein
LTASCSNRGGDANVAAGVDTSTPQSCVDHSSDGRSRTTPDRRSPQVPSSTSTNDPETSVPGRNHDHVSSAGGRTSETADGDQDGGSGASSSMSSDSRPRAGRAPVIGNVNRTEAAEPSLASRETPRRASRSAVRSRSVHTVTSPSSGNTATSTSPSGNLICPVGSRDMTVPAGTTVVPGSSAVSCSTVAAGRAGRGGSRPTSRRIATTSSSGAWSSQ